MLKLLHDQRLSESLNDQVLKLYNGYRAMLVELIARAQQKGICTRRSAQESAAAFLLSALNGLLIEYLAGSDGIFSSDRPRSVISLKNLVIWVKDNGGMGSLYREFERLRE